ncbi:hypothetical protein LO80_09070 [Candidatus Francisella endociliophora]|uniref:Rotein n=1 Tax=Candidatus Francisella endociliophora TaxID=653937 RepID=A0A097ERA8_9GAMM|nr:hypothetical protein [Francisella sp. FSC1006]AIT10108.1 hypothetical protein LO80_09070 [Francisella sp. FSC1006]
MRKISLKFVVAILIGAPILVNAASVDEQDQAYQAGKNFGQSLNKMQDKLDDQKDNISASMDKVADQTKQNIDNASDETKLKAKEIGSQISKDFDKTSESMKATAKNVQDSAKNFKKGFEAGDKKMVF